MPSAPHKGLERASQWAQWRPTAHWYLRIHESRAWKLRTVETATVPNAREVERNVTLDIDTSILRELADKRRLKRPSVPIPLTKLPKLLLLDLDVRDSANRSIHILSRTADAFRAQLLMLAKIELSGIAPGNLPDAIIRLLWTAAYGTISAAERNHLARGVAEMRPPRTRLESLIKTVSRWAIEPSTRDLWLRILARTEFRTILTDFTVNYNPLVEVPLGSGVYVVKFRHTEINVQQLTPTLRQRFGLRPLDVLFAATYVGTSASEHLRVSPPSGMYIQEALPVLAARQPTAPAYLEWRRSAEHAVMYTRDVPEATHRFVLRLSPIPSTFLRPVQFTVLATTAILIVGSIYEFLFQTLTEHATAAGPATTIVLLATSVASAFLVRQGEHDYLNECLRVPRMLAAASSGSALIASASLAMQLHPLRYIWLACGVFSFAIWMVLAVASRLSVIRLRHANDQANTPFFVHMPSQRTRK
jgi:hypothetical protein